MQISSFLPHSSKCVQAQDEISPIACPRVCDHNRHTTWGAVVRICAPNLLAVANNFSVSRVMFHCLHKGPQMHSHVTNIIVTTVFILFITIIFHTDTTLHYTPLAGLQQTHLVHQRCNKDSLQIP